MNKNHFMRLFESNVLEKQFPFLDIDNQNIN